MVDNNTGLFGEENVLILTSGPLCGARFFSLNKFEVLSKSPLTGIFIETNCGGKGASKLKNSRFDGLIIRGKSNNLVHTWMNNGKAEIYKVDNI